jgi:hypothetical protein
MGIKTLSLNCRVKFGKNINISSLKDKLYMTKEMNFLTQLNCPCFLWYRRCMGACVVRSILARV